MTTAFHIDPNTGDPRSCSKPRACGWGDHYATADEARAVYEEMMSDFQVMRLRKERRQYASADEAKNVYWSLRKAAEQAGKPSPVRVDRRDASVLWLHVGELVARVH